MNTGISNGIHSRYESGVFDEMTGEQQTLAIEAEQFTEREK